MYTVKKISEMLQITPQAVYQKREELEEKGFMYKDNSNKTMITAQGFEYLKNIRISNMQENRLQVEKAQELKTTEEDQEQEEKKDYITLLIENLKKSNDNLTKQVEKLEQEKEFFKNQVEEKDKLIHAYFNTHLLKAGEEEKEKEEEKKGFFKRLFH